MDGISLSRNPPDWLDKVNAPGTPRGESVLEILPVGTWHGPFPARLQQHALAALEAGKIIMLPHLSFNVAPAERKFLGSSVSGGARKNVSFDPRNRKISNVTLDQDDAAALARLMDCFGDCAFRFLRDLLPAYGERLVRARTSYRPEEIRGRLYSSPRKDDTRLHVDAFPSRPVRGERILRFFSNIADDGAPRHWTVGEPFFPFARRFMPRVRSPLPGGAWLREQLGLTKGRQSPYDHYMLALHDLGKLDGAYQAQAPRTHVQFAAGTSWFCFTDQVLHAAHAGHDALEQTFHLPVAAMADPSTAPLRILEAMAGKSLA